MTPSLHALLSRSVHSFKMRPYLLEPAGWHSVPVTLAGLAMSLAPRCTGSLMSVKDCVGRDRVDRNYVSIQAVPGLSLQNSGLVDLPRELLPAFGPLCSHCPDQFAEQVGKRMDPCPSPVTEAVDVVCHWPRRGCNGAQPEAKAKSTWSGWPLPSAGYLGDRRGAHWPPPPVRFSAIRWAPKGAGHRENTVRRRELRIGPCQLNRRKEVLWGETIDSEMVALLPPS